MILIQSGEALSHCDTLLQGLRPSAQTENAVDTLPDCSSGSSGNLPIKSLRLDRGEGA